MKWTVWSTYIFLFFLGLSLWFFYRMAVERATLREKVQADWVKKRLTRISWREKTVRMLVEWSRGLIPLGERFLFFSADDELERTLLRAGRPFRLQVKEIHGLKILLAFFGLIIGILAMVPLFFLGPATLIIFPLIGYFVPIWLLKQSAHRRQEAISREIPDFLDTVSITLSAGLGLDAALQRYVEKISSPWSQEVEMYLDEVRLGVPREQALQHLIQRTGNSDVENLANDLIQAMRLGVPFSKTFRLQAEGMRKIRGERAKTLAEKAKPKLALVISLVITPSILVLILGAMAVGFLTTQ